LIVEKPSSRLRVAAVVICAIAVAVAAAVWWNREAADAQAIRSRIEALGAEINATAVAGLDSATRGQQIGSFFTEDAVVDLGKGGTPIVGRSTIVGMAVRLQTPLSAFRLQVDDVGVDVKPGAASADATLTASFILRTSAGEESRDAREFALALTRAGNEWQIARVTAVDTLR
jgi:hypothetical protein